jgi:glycosyltransferase involved in cell wall biosynthesis
MIRNNEAAANQDDPGELRILFIAHSYPPDGQVGAKRAAALCRYLPSYGINPVVITIPEESVDSRDESVAAPAGIRVEHARPFPTPLELYKRVRRRNRQDPPASQNFERQLPSSAPSGSGADGVYTRRQSLVAALGVLGSHWSWYWPAMRAGLRVIAREPISLVLSTSPPGVAHIVARRLARKHRVPWIADFRDLWAHDPWFSRGLPRSQLRLERTLERRCLESAGAVTCVTDAIRESLERHYADLDPSKFMTVSNGYDPALYGGDPAREARETRHGPPYLCVHLGWLYGQRRIDTFCQALAALIDSGRVAPGSVKILLVGGVDHLIERSAREAAPELFLDGTVEFRPMVNWREGQEMIRTADLLLVFQGNHRAAVPAKFYEYLLTGNPIFSSTKEGALSRITTATGAGVWADPDDAEATGSKLLEALRLPRRSAEEVERSAGQYDYRRLAGELAALVRRLVEKRREAYERP